MSKPQLFQKRFFQPALTFYVLLVIFVSLISSAFTQNRADRLESSLRRITQSCESTKHKVVAEINSPFRPNPKTELLRQINQFRAGIRKGFPRGQVVQWEERLMLDQLQQTLREEEADLALVDTILQRLNSDDREIQRQSFVLLKKSLESNRPLLWRQNQQLYIDDVKAVFDLLPGLIENYLGAPDASHAEAISEVLEYLSATPTANELIAQIRKMLVQPNFYVFVNSDVIAPFFYQDIDETVPVNDNILGTWVQGMGQLTGSTHATLVPSRDSAIIRVTFEGELPTTTVGTNGPVRVHSQNMATVTTVKDIIITGDSIKTTRAASDVWQSSHITHVDYALPGPLIRMIASNQIQSRKPASDAESKRLTKLRFDQRVDSEVDESMKSFDDYFNTAADEWSDSKGFAVHIDGLATTYRELMLKAVVGSRSQLTTMSEPPPDKTGTGLFMQLHESLVNNVCADELSGKTLAEEQVMAKLQERFPQLFANHEVVETSDEPSLTISFSNRPVRANFTENTIILTIETTAIERSENVYSGMTIEFQFHIEPIKGGFQLIAEPPEVLPLGFDPEIDRLSVRETTIRAIIMKKLARLTEKPVEWKEIALLLDEECGDIVFHPVYFSTAAGWLSVGLNMAE